MSKLRVSEMAGEFGISADEVITLLRQMDVSVRGPASLLSDDQVARIRARWEREKRARIEKQAAPATTTRRRRGVVAAPEPAPVVVPTADGGGGIRRRRRSEIAVAPPEPEEPAPELAEETEYTTAEPALAESDTGATTTAGGPEVVVRTHAPTPPAALETPLPIIEREVLPSAAAGPAEAAERLAERPLERPTGRPMLRPTEGTPHAAPAVPRHAGPVGGAGAPPE
ncbi:MAG TPA: translation initiation factor IF-2 N-terminal domain-containing protein, partial [Gemmatimonadaceae bacterium]|nr:translation initiation factor IF-2 N-terminal domain-containing protein [Gemmatimonadaceae bacterium]